MLATVKKAVGALLGGVTGGAVVVVLGAFGVTVAPELAASIAIGLATLGTYLAPRNVPAPVEAR
jgi:tetrahydromethanopterin S-methyltransferase subunit D